MKTKIILLFLLAIFSCAINASNTDVRSAERNFKNAQNEISQLASKKKATEAKLQKAEADLQEATAKMEETKDKPKSLPYKNAVKKAEASQQKIAELEFSLQSIEADIDSKSAELRNYQQIILSAQQAKEDEVAAKKQAKEDAKLAKQREKDSMKMAKQQAKEERSVKQQEQENTSREEMAIPSYQTVESNNKGDASSHHSSNGTSSNENKAAGWLWIFLIAIFVIGIWVEFKKRHHCPKCGKWFTLESEGDTRVRQIGSNGKTVRKGARKKYRCRNCNHPVSFISWF